MENISFTCFFRICLRAAILACSLIGTYLYATMLRISPYDVLLTDQLRANLPMPPPQQQQQQQQQVPYIPPQLQQQDLPMAQPIGGEVVVQPDNQ